VTARALTPVIGALAWADHGAGATATGSGWGLGWVFAVGLVVVVVLAAWAMFAPAGEEPDDQRREGRRPP